MGEPLTDSELEEFARRFPPNATTMSALRRAHFDLTVFPVVVPGQNSIDWWRLVDDLVDDGAIEDGRHRLLLMGASRFPANPVFTQQAAAQVRRVLILGASPAVARAGSALDPLRSDQEYRAILDAAQGIYLEYRPFATVADIGHTLEYQPDVLHLACHGKGRTLTFHDRLASQPDPRNARVIHAADLASALLAYERESGHRLQGIVLNACTSVDAGKELQTCATTVIAHDGDLPDTAAPTVASMLYGKLTEPRSLASAARLVKAELPLLDDRGRPIADGIVILGEGSSGT